MKNARLWLLFLVLVVLAARNYWVADNISRSPEFLALIRDRERRFAWEQINRAWRVEAESNMLACVTNDQIGLREVTSHVIAFVDDAPAHWQGNVGVDFVNRLGGIEWTNLCYKFVLSRPSADSLVGSHVAAHLDGLRMDQQAAAKGVSQ